MNSGNNNGLQFPVIIAFKSFEIPDPQRHTRNSGLKKNYKKKF